MAGLSTFYVAAAATAKGRHGPCQDVPPETTVARTLPGCMASHFADGRDKYFLNCEDFAGCIVTTSLIEP
jgi:hypothetical protein